ncbi:unnamed protein product [Nippostrongylus brasiliensis]|uniref:Secreted protein n=1 Tax=Nippostrongylus brasiliensis TaxID=27835 RepID=A0A0N4XWW3_NIPBR|nr:unnamed protein product [Nippostrongylus brasiliensis]
MNMTEEREDLLLLVMVILLLLLSAIIWVAFCIAVKKTAMRLLELKRQRRREYDNSRAALPSYEEALTMSNTQGPNSALPPPQRAPPYKPNALKTERLLSTARLKSAQTNYGFGIPSCDPTFAQISHFNGIAPDRPGSHRAMVLPPSYDSATRENLTPEPPRRASTDSSSPQGIYTLSSALANTSL